MKRTNKEIKLLEREFEEIKMNDSRWIYEKFNANVHNIITIKNYIERIKELELKVILKYICSSDVLFIFQYKPDFYPNKLNHKYITIFINIDENYRWCENIDKNLIKRITYMWQPPINKIYDMLSDYELIIEEFAKHVVLEYTTNKSLYEKYIIENMYKLYDITEILRKYNITEKELLNEKEKFLQINIDAFKEYNTINFNEIQIAIQQIKSCKE